MARNYDLDTKAAREAGQTGRRITEPGLYTGKFKFAWGETNAKGNELVNLFFVSDEGQEAGPVALYTFNDRGEQLFGFTMLNAIMTCMSVKSLKSERGQVTQYDFDTRADVTKEKEIYPALIGPRIGLVIQMEEYTGRNGAKTKPLIANAYNAETRMVAKEILDRATEPKLLANVEKWLAQNPIKHERKRMAPAGTPPISSGSDFDDSETIPF